MLYVFIVLFGTTFFIYMDFAGLKVSVEDRYKDFINVNQEFIASLDEIVVSAGTDFYENVKNDTLLTETDKLKSSFDFIEKYPVDFATIFIAKDGEVIFTNNDALLNLDSQYNTHFKFVPEVISMAKIKQNYQEVIKNKDDNLSYLASARYLKKESSNLFINTELIFEKMISALGGPNSFLSNYTTEMTKASYIADISLGKKGYIKEIKTRELGLILIELGGGRKQVNDNINYQVGFDNVIGIGDSVDASTPIIQVHAESKDDFERTKNQIIKCFILSDGKVSPLQPIYERIS